MALNTKKRRAIKALLSTQTVAAAAEMAEVSPRTLYRWMSEDRLFRLELNTTEDRILEQATRELVSLQSEAIATLKGIMLLGKSEGQRRMAASAILDFTYRAVELRTIVGRLEKLENQQ